MLGGAGKLEQCRSLRHQSLLTGSPRARAYLDGSTLSTTKVFVSARRQNSSRGQSSRVRASGRRTIWPGATSIAAILVGFNEVSQTPKPASYKRIILCSDGTWLASDLGDKSVPLNVDVGVLPAVHMSRFAEMYRFEKIPAALFETL